MAGGGLTTIGAALSQRWRPEYVKARSHVIDGVDGMLNAAAYAGIDFAIGPTSSSAFFKRRIWWRG